MMGPRCSQRASVESISLSRQCPLKLLAGRVSMKGIAVLRFTDGEAKRSAG